MCAFLYQRFILRYISLWFTTIKSGFITYFICLHIQGQLKRSLLEMCSNIKWFKNPAIAYRKPSASVSVNKEYSPYIAGRFVIPNEGYGSPTLLPSYLIYTSMLLGFRQFSKIIKWVHFKNQTLYKMTSIKRQPHIIPHLCGHNPIKRGDTKFKVCFLSILIY